MKDDILKIENQLCFRIYSASRKIIRLYKPLLDKLEITYPQYLTMLVMWQKEIIDFKSLSTILDMTTGTLTPILQRLELKGYIKKEKDKEDDRRVNVILTELGKNIKEEALCVPKELVEKLDLSDKDYLKYADVLDDLLNKIDKGLNN